MNTGTVIFSLDFELGWGHRRIRPEYNTRLREREDRLFEYLIDVIDLFTNYSIPGTWATVGKLGEIGEDDLFHAPTILDYLVDAPVNHEIGLHSYEHRRYDEMSREEVKMDLDCTIKALQDWVENPETIVFPRNRIAHVDAIQEFGVSGYRSKEALEQTNRLQRLLMPNTYSQTPQSPPVAVPGSIFLAANRPRWYRRWYAHRGLKYAIEQTDLVHYWLHPHNVVTDRMAISELDSLLKKVRDAESRGDVDVHTMASYLDKVSKG